MQIHYLEMHGAGNRILVVDRRGMDDAPPSSDAIRNLGQAQQGPAFDQLMWVCDAHNRAHAARYRVFNVDGSEVEQCGNGARCVAWVLARDNAKREFVLESPAGLVAARIHADDRIAVSMGLPDFDPKHIPFEAAQQQQQYALTVAGTNYDVSALSLGNPHCVLQVDDVATADVTGIGAQIESHPRFPQHTNVGFMHIRGRSAIDLRVFERGAGETLACGTGACAAVVAGCELGLLDDDVSVRLPGGLLMVNWPGSGEPVWLSGSAELINEGTIRL